LQAFGGLAATARALGHRHASTVHGWLRSGRIPAWRWRELQEAAERRHVALPPSFGVPGARPGIAAGAAAGAAAASDPKALPDTPVGAKRHGRV
jgi:hypothetical protein